MIHVARRQFAHGFLDDLSAVNRLLQSSARDEPVDDHVHRLANAVGTIYCLRVGRWVPAWINYSQSQCPTQNYTLDN